MFVVGTAGHVDHGKSLLVEALTGIDPDRLREEKARGMTIDLGFAWMTLPSGRSVSIIDVPGHERFIKNMLAGAGGIDLALLVIAADDGVMPQTREHLAILDLLGITRGVVALTKMDLVDADWLNLVENDVASLLEGTALEGAPIARCSARTGEGLEALLRTIDCAVAELPPKRDVARPRLPIDRVFTIGGFGTVVTGTLVEGMLNAGDEVEVMPGELRGRVRGLQTHKDSVECALPGTRTAVNVTGIEREALRRGMVLARPGALRSTDVIDARLRATGALRHNMRVTFHSGADEANAVVRLLDADRLEQGHEAWAQIKLESKIAVLPGDRFVVRTPNDTVGGGIIVDTAPKRHRRRYQPTLDALAAKLSEAPADRLREAIARSPLADRPAIVRDAQVPDAIVDGALSELIRSGAIRAFEGGEGTRFATTEFAELTHATAMELLDAYHAEHPLRAGMPIEEFRVRLRIGQRELAALVQAWPDVRVDARVAASASFVPAPSPAVRAAMDAYLAALRAAPERPAAVTLPAEQVAYLAERGEVVDAGDGFVLDAGVFEAMQGRLRAHMEEQGSITLAEARDLLGTSRRYVQSLLEHMDRLRITRRVGERRVLR